MKNDNGIDNLNLNNLAGGSDTGPVTGNAGDLGGRRGVEPSVADGGATTAPSGSSGSFEADAVAPQLGNVPNKESTLEQVGAVISPPGAEMPAEEANEQT